jgi:hypothetical protein
MMSSDPQIHFAETDDYVDDGLSHAFSSPGRVEGWSSVDIAREREEEDVSPKGTGTEVKGRE